MKGYNLRQSGSQEPVGTREPENQNPKNMKTNPTIEKTIYFDRNRPKIKKNKGILTKYRE